MRRPRRHTKSTVTSHAVGDVGQKIKNVTYNVHGKLSGTVRLVQQRSSHVKRPKTAVSGCRSCANKKGHSAIKKSYPPGPNDGRYTSAFVINANINHVTRNRHHTIPPLSSAVLPMTLDYLLTKASKHGRRNRRPKVVPHLCADIKEYAESKKPAKAQVKHHNTQSNVKGRMKSNVTNISHKHSNMQHSKGTKHIKPSNTRSSTKRHPKRTKKAPRSNFYDDGSDVETLISTENARCRRACCRYPTLSDTDETREELGSLSVVAQCSCQDDIESTSRRLVRKKVSRSAPVFKMKPTDQFVFNGGRTDQKGTTAGVSTVAAQELAAGNEKGVTNKSRSACFDVTNKKRLKYNYKTSKSQLKKKAMPVSGVSKNNPPVQQGMVGSHDSSTLPGQNDCNCSNSETAASESLSALRIDVELPACSSSLHRSGSSSKPATSRASKTSVSSSSQASVLHISTTATSNESCLSTENKSNTSVSETPNMPVPAGSGLLIQEKQESANALNTVMPTFSITKEPGAVTPESDVAGNSEAKTRYSLDLPVCTVELKTTRPNNEVTGDNILSVKKENTYVCGNGDKSKSACRESGVSYHVTDITIDTVTDTSRPEMNNTNVFGATKSHESENAISTTNLDTRHSKVIDTVKTSPAKLDKGPTGHDEEGICLVEQTQDAVTTTFDAVVNELVQTVLQDAKHDNGLPQGTNADSKHNCENDLGTSSSVSSKGSELYMSDFMTSVESASAEHGSDTDSFISDRGQSSDGSGE